MNKAQLIELIQNKLGADTTKKHAEEALAAVLESIKEGVQESGKVQIIGFGTFATKTREARTGRNPKTGKAINIPASKTVAFKASSALKDYDGSCFPKEHFSFSTPSSADRGVFLCPAAGVHGLTGWTPPSRMPPCPAVLVRCSESPPGVNPMEPG